MWFPAGTHAGRPSRITATYLVTLAFSAILCVLLQTCSITPLVRNADALVKASRRFLGDTITFGVMRHTFMKQFCAGETEEDLRPTIDMLRANGIGAIIDYAGEV